MSFDYNKNKQSHNGDSFWTSYSDLFLGLSTIFLLLYVTSSLRTGTDAIKQQVDNRKLTMQNEELKSQLKMYENVKADYLEKQASKSEAQEYEELMDKLTLLKEDAKDERDRLAQEALENENKAKALNKYQQMVRNIINANKVAKTKIIARNDIIDEQDTTIDEQKQDIDTLEADVEQKKDQLEQSEKKIAQTKKALEKNKKQLLQAFKNNEMTKKEYEAKARELQEQSSREIKNLQADAREIKGQLNQVASELKNTQSALSNTQSALSAKAAEAESLQGKIAGLRSAHDAQMARERAAFDAEMKKSAADGAERARREGEFRAAAAAKERALGDKIAGLSGELAKAKEEMDARRGIAREIQKGLAKAGVKADVDMQTGEVVIDFGDNYFDSDSAKLKAEMKAVIEKAMPVYSKSLFGNPKVANKISSVEVIGFASPTYQGRYVDPHSSRPEDKTALKYNMNLSYQRANAIFNHLLDSRSPEFEHQKDLMAHMKVSGRSFLEVMKVKSRAPSSATEFCKSYDCKKAQRVIVRFSMDGKK